MPEARHKSWVYTVWNHTPGDIERLKAFSASTHRCCIELSEEGKQHLQGYIVMKRVYSFNALKKIMPDGAHLEVAKNITDGENYCVKGEIIIDVKGPGKGTRTDISKLKVAVNEGKTMGDIAEEFPKEFLAFHSGIEKMMRLRIPQRTWQMEVHILWGEPGTGKSRWVWDKYPQGSVYPKARNKWWDHYTGQNVVLIDDFDPVHSHDLTFDGWLRLLDRYPMFVEYKGGTCNFGSKVICITSNFDPCQWFTERENRHAFLRRISYVTWFSSCGRMWNDRRPWGIPITKADEIRNDPVPTWEELTGDVKSYGRGEIPDLPNMGTDIPH